MFAVRILMSVLIMGWSVDALAQRGVGEIHLRIADQSGAAVAASGVISSDGVDVRRPYVTGDDGTVVLAALPYGRYQVTATRPGFSSEPIVVDVQSALPVTQILVMRVAGVQANVAVSAEAGTLAAIGRTGSVRYIGARQMADRPATMPGRSIIDLVNAQPGWLLEANGILHARGSEYQVQYVIDGIPLRDNRSPAFAQSLGAEEFDSIAIRTGGYPAEFGGKLGGVVEINTVRDTRQGLHGSATVQGGSFATGSGFATAQFGLGGFRIGGSAEAMTTDRYLDPPTEDNFTNEGAARGWAARLERAWTDNDRTRGYLYRRTSSFEVPNELLQQEAGQRQARTAGEWLGQVSHQHVFASPVLLHAGAMVRDTTATLTSNTQSIPILASQDRGFREAYLNASVTVSRGAHELKAGGEWSAIDIREQFSSTITARRLLGVRLFDGDIPTQFDFDEERTGHEAAAFVQDTIRAGSATLSAGVRLDRHALMVEETAVSPRLSASWQLRPSMALHAAYDRTFESQPVENIVLASLDLVDELGGEGESLALRPSRGRFAEGGASFTVRDRLRLEATYFQRRANNVTDDELLLNTAVSFPIAFASARVHGLETAVDVPKWGPWSASLSYSLSQGTGQLPLTGGLFLGDEAEEGLESDEEFELTQDQRHTLRGRLRADLSSRVWVAGLFRYDSGLPVELEGEFDEDDAELLRAQYGDAVFEQVDLDRGRVKRSLALDFAAGAQLAGNSGRGLRLQAEVMNVLDRLNVINFAGLLSGTAIAPRRSFAVRLHAEF